MKYPQAKAMKNSAARVLMLAVCVMAVTLSASAQFGGITATRTLSDTKLAMANIGIDIEQCANGPFSAPIKCNVSSGNDGYARGALNESKSHYVEGDSVPIRIVATGLTVGDTYTVTIGYDYTKGGKYANDYLTTYDRTESVMNNPCVNVAGCTLASATTFAIPLDPQVANGFDGAPGGGDDIVQIPGNFTCFGCTITGATVYTLSGSTASDSSKTFTLTFTATAENIVIAYGSHISTRTDWGLNNSAIAITGSPYHNYIVDFPGANSGSRDLQLSATAVIFPASITIIKSVTTLLPGGGVGNSSTFSFNFTATNFTPGSFSLVDDNNITHDRKSDATRIAFGAANATVVTEQAYPNIWTLQQIACTSQAGGLPNVNNNTTSLPNRSATIVLEEGESVTCTFFNTQLAPTAAPASVSGRVVDSFGNGIGNARISVTSAGDGSSHMAVSNPFGYYTIGDLEISEFYVLSVSHKRYTFSDDTRTFSLNEDLADMDFVANP
ncbi:MAG: carboxypeptidase-like regulatory domain-containing protein [Acidobacteriota bacterium]